MTELFLPPISIAPEEAARYMQEGIPLAAEERRRIEEESKRLLSAIAPGFAAAEYSLVRETSGVRIKGTVLCLPGEDIRQLLKNCESCVLFAATLGLQSERYLSSKRRVSEELLAEACATAAIESLCDGLTEQIAAWANKAGLFLTMRYSPGYGDLPLGVQRDFLSVLNVQRRLGMTLTPGGMMIPRKSVTAVIGLSRIQTRQTRRCEECPNRRDCPYRKVGQRCEPN